MRDLIKELIREDVKTGSSVYLREIALLMEEIDRLKLEIKELKNGDVYKRRSKNV